MVEASFLKAIKDRKKKLLEVSMKSCPLEMVKRSVEKLRMRGLLSGNSEVARRGHQPLPEVMHPYAVHENSRGCGVRAIRQLPGIGEAAPGGLAALLVARHLHLGSVTPQHHEFGGLHRLACDPAQFR